MISAMIILSAVSLPTPPLPPAARVAAGVVATSGLELAARRELERSAEGLRRLRDSEDPFE